MMAERRGDLHMQAFLLQDASARRQRRSRDRADALEQIKTLAVEHGISFTDGAFDCPSGVDLTRPYVFSSVISGESAGLFGPVWSSYQMANSCAIDTVWMMVLGWCTGGLTLVDSGDASKSLRSAYGYLVSSRNSSSSSSSSSTSSSSSSSWSVFQFSKLVFWYGLTNSPDGRAMPFSFDGDNYMTIKGPLGAVMSVLGGTFSRTYSGRCGHCGQDTSSDYTVPFFELEGTKRLEVSGLHEQLHLSSLVLGALSTEAHWKCSCCDTTTGLPCSSVRVDRHLCVWLDIFLDSKRASSPLGNVEIDLTIQLGGCEMYLDRIVMFPNGNHYTCYLWYPGDGDRLLPGWYYYDGMVDYGGSLRRKDIVANGRYCADKLPEQLEMVQVCAVVYTVYDTTEQRPAFSGSCKVVPPGNVALGSKNIPRKSKGPRKRKKSTGQIIDLCDSDSCDCSCDCEECKQAAEWAS